MQREILFRGKRVDNGEWIEGFLLKDRNLGFYICEGLGCGGEEVIPETVGQYSGYEALDDTKIFEGDIIDDLGLNRGDVELSPDSGWVVNTSHATLPLSQLHKDSLVTGSIHDHHTTSKESL